MALNFNGTAVLIDSSQIPAGYVKPVVTTFTDPEYQTLRYEVQVAKSAVEDANPVTTFTNIMDDAAIGINKVVSDKLTADLDTVGNTVDAFAQLTNVKSNQVFGDDLYNNSTVLYRCTVTIKFKLA